MATLKLYLDYVLTKNIPLLDIQKSRPVCDVASDYDHRPVLLIFMVRFLNRGAQHQPKLDLADLKDDEWRKKFSQLSTEEGVCFASAETKSAYNSVGAFRRVHVYECVYEFMCIWAGDFSQEKRLRRKLRRHLQKTAKTNGRQE
ncbi:hypothetical protein RB195_018288 [Necator americanus]